MDPTRQAFENALKAAPRDYVGRMAFADYLTEIGEDDEADRQRNWIAADDWLRAWIGRHYEGWGDGDGGVMDYDDVIRNILEDGYHVQYGSQSAQDEMGGSETAREEFYRNFEIVTGVKLGAAKRAYGPFSCSC